jgi:hypothetical protein
VVLLDACHVLVSFVWCSLDVKHGCDRRLTLVHPSRSFMQKEGNRYVRTKALNDKLMLHIMVLCLVVSNFRLHIST